MVPCRLLLCGSVSAVSSCYADYGSAFAIGRPCGSTLDLETMVRGTPPSGSEVGSQTRVNWEERLMPSRRCCKGQIQ